MKATITTHNGSMANQNHNMRDKNAIKNQTHINPNGIHENWINRDIHEEYQKLFGEALERYNKKQKRKDRKKTNYFQEVKKDKQKNTAYEMIISVGSKNNPIPDDLGKQIMYEFCKTWSKRNPNFHLLGCYYHADEEGVPHTHIDYIPVGHGFKKSLDTQVSQERALNEMGYFSEGQSKTAQMKWTKAQNKYLEELCNERGITVIHLNEKRQHLETQLYKEKQELLAEYDFELEQTYNEKYQELEREFDYRYDELDKAVEERYLEESAIKNLNWEKLEDIQKKELARNKELSFLRELREYCESHTVKQKSIMSYFKSYLKNRQKERNRDDDDDFVR